MRNRELAIIFSKIADAFELKGELPFKILAYRKVARILEDLTEDIEIIWKKGDLRKIPGVGEGIAKKIDEYLHTGEMRKYEETMRDIPEGLLSLLSIQGVGAKTLKLAHRELKVNNKADLARVLNDGSLSMLPGMGDKKVENIKKGLEIFSIEEKRISIGVALPLVEEIINWMGKSEISNISPAGSLRRMKETIGDIDILVAGERGVEVIEHFTKFPRVERILAKGSTKGSIMVREGHQIDLRVVPLDCYGAALQYFTGSKAHNIKLRAIARKRGLKLSEYGVFRGGKKIAGAKEEDVYASLGIPWIPPELREDRGEIEFVSDGKELPDIINYDELKGDLHIHSNYSDGSNSIRELAKYAKKMGYEYIAITDHSRSDSYAGGIGKKKLLEQAKEIEKVENEVGIKILKGIELKIKKDGELDFPDSVLKNLDIVIGAIHTFPKEIDMTPALISACKNPWVDVIAHPTGRLISRRAGYKVNIEKLIKAAKDTHTFLEINCYPDRLDLSDINATRAKESGVKLTLGSDAHNIGMLNSIRFGIGVARRAWCSKDDIINTSKEPWKLLKHSKK
ncbi:DNA polymerase/3'-5' exonuclease PolX [candidate division WOR-3 bacterium]|nr:DNA polymerase/3'-5' exonuclease PolX [candidate division WOR-3 bacterium]